jgi:hypothetical protein
MAATKIISGVAREIWQELVPQGGGGPPAVITTGIRASNQQRSRVRGTLTVNSIVGVPVVSAMLNIVDGVFMVQVFNTAGGTSFTWTLDVERTQSTQQGLDHAYPNGVIQVVSGVLSTGGLAAPQTLAQTYDIGAVDADQRMIVSTAKGGGVTIDCTDAAVTAAGVSFEVRQNAAWSLPTVISRRGDSDLGPVVQFDKARGTYPIPADVQDNDLLGVTEYYGRLGGVPILGTRLTSIAIGTGAGLDAGFDVYVTAASAPVHVLRIDSRAAGGLPELVMQGDGSIIPATNHLGKLGSLNQVWGTASIDRVLVYHDLRIDCTDAIVVGSGPSLEVRQSVAHSTPVLFHRNGADTVGPILEFSKARGTYAVPADVLTTDLLGSCDFYGQSGGVPAHAVRIAAEAVMGGGFHATLDFKVKGPVTAVATALRIWNTGTAVRSIFSGVAEVLPAAYPNTSTLGIAIVPWSAAHIDTVNAYTNVCVGGGAANIAEQSVVLLGAGSVLPTISAAPEKGPAGSVFLQGYPQSATPGDKIILALTQEENIQSVSGVTPNFGIPILYNGKYCILFAYFPPA